MDAPTRKVAIPRLQRPGQPQQTTKDRRRVPRACMACRNHKIRCTGDTPRCRHCEATDRSCVYILPRKDRLKIITERCIQMATLLSSLKGSVDDEGKERISKLLGLVEEDISEIRNTPSNPDVDSERFKEFTSVADMSPIEPQAPLESMNTESIDLIDEDLFKDDRVMATGFIGKNSELQWLRTIMLQLERDDESATGSAYTVENIKQVSSFNYYLNDSDMDLGLDVDPYEFPSWEDAEHLLNCYMTTVHDSFPIIPRQQFEEDFRRYCDAVFNGNAHRISPKWLAIMNLVLAIGSKHSDLVKAEWRVREGEHAIYAARARQCAPNEFTPNHPDVPQIQTTGLLAFYYLSIGQISHAWITVGLALRSAIALGLHVRNEDPSAPDSKKEMLVRIWWSLYTLERLLGIITGRPSILADSTCSVPLPAPISEDQLSELADEVTLIRDHVQYAASISSTSSSSFPSEFPGLSFDDMMDFARTPSTAEPLVANCGSFFKAIAQIGLTTQEILTSLYSAATMIRSIADVQQDMVQLSHRLDQWVAGLPSEFNFQIQDPRQRPNISPRYARERLLLGFHFCSARILLTRPSLSGLAQLASDPKAPIPFIRRMAGICIEAAKTVTDFLPDQPNPFYIYGTGPWWSIVHVLMQAISVFLLGLLYSVPGSQEILLLSQYAKKLVRWLRAMKDSLAERAYQVSINTLNAVAHRLSLDLSDLWTEDALVFPRSGLVKPQIIPYSAKPVGLPSGTHMAAPAFTSFNTAPTFQQQNIHPTFEDPYFRNG